MDLDKCLCCLSRNPTLKFVAMSSSFSYSQTMGATTAQPLSLARCWQFKKMKTEMRMKLMEKSKVRVVESMLSEWAKQ